MATGELSTTGADNLLNFNGSKRLPVILQAEIAECGLACLAMILGYHGFTVDMLSLRSKYRLSGKGFGLNNIMEIASALNLMPRALRAEPEDLVRIQLPCILHWGLNHFVVLKAIRKNSFIIHDPAFGERRIEAREFSNEFTGIVLELTAGQEFKKGEETQSLKLSHFWSNITGIKRSLGQVLLLSLLLQLFSLASPFYMQIVVDDVLLRNDNSLLVVLALGFGLLMLIQVGTTTLRELVILNISNRMSMQMSANLFRHLIRLPLDYFSKRHMGDIVSRFGSLAQVRDLLTHSLVAAIIDGIMAIVTLAAMFFYSAKLALIVIAAVVTYAFIRWIFFKPFKRLNEESIVASAKENSHFMESVRAIQTIKIFQRETDRQHQWQNRLADVMNKNIQIANWGIGYGAINGVLFGLVNLIVIYFAALTVMESVMSLGMLYAFMSYQGRFIASMDSLISKWIELKMLDIQLMRIADIAFTPTEALENDEVSHEVIDCRQESNFSEENSSNLIPFSILKPSRITGKIEVRDLAYRYSDFEPHVFKGLNFTIQPGETVAITGASGCGKTTLLKCLMGLIEPIEGEILIDGRLLSQVTNYRSQIAAVMQDDQLLSGDIFENISCFDSKLDVNKVQHCAQMACIHSEIVRMPMQYNTLVGDMGSALSGGQKQRLILARAFYRDPRILFMDEATSHLDVNNEQLVNGHIHQLNITRILVAHRPETVKSAGRQINLTMS